MAFISLHEPNVDVCPKGGAAPKPAPVFVAPNAGGADVAGVLNEKF